MSSEREEEGPIDIIFRFGLIFAGIIAVAAIGWGVYHLLIIADLI